MVSPSQNIRRIARRGKVARILVLLCAVAISCGVIYHYTTSQPPTVLKGDGSALDAREWLDSTTTSWLTRGIWVIILEGYYKHDGLESAIPFLLKKDSSLILYGTALVQSSFGLELYSKIADTVSSLLITLGIIIPIGLESNLWILNRVKISQDRARRKDWSSHNTTLSMV